MADDHWSGAISEVGITAVPPAITSPKDLRAEYYFAIAQPIGNMKKPITIDQLQRKERCDASILDFI